MATSAISGEQYTSKIGAFFSDPDRARLAARSLHETGGFRQDQVRIIEPNDPALSTKLEPEVGGVARTAVKSHVTFGVIGALVGAIVILLVDLAGVQFIESSRGYSYGIGIALGAVLGMLVAGLVTLRPDQDVLISNAKRAARKGQWSVVVHVADQREHERAKSLLDGFSDSVAGSL